MLHDAPKPRVLPLRPTLPARPPIGAVRPRPPVTTVHEPTGAPMPEGTAKRAGEGPVEVLRRVFGYDAFRPIQGDVVAHVCAGGDAFVLMPTGGGKSMCYMVPALVRPGVAVVVSPLIALMKDQVDQAREVGIRAVAINSSMPRNEVVKAEAAMMAGEVDAVFVAPERLSTERFRDVVGRTRVSLFAIDECHCVSQMGHDFRPDYLEVGPFLSAFPDVPKIALTATADEQTRKDVLERLGLRNAQQFVGSFDRTNITYVIVPKKDARRQFLAFLESKHRGNAGIVYCLSKKSVDETTVWLRGHGYDAIPYHAGLPSEVRAANQERFLKCDGVICVATIAFGMGINKPDVRFVAHLDLPRSVENYYQETGRAGRDGVESDAWMAYGLNDFTLNGRMIEQSDLDDAQKRIQRAKLSALLGIVETPGCRRIPMLRYFGETHAGGCGKCDRCLDPVADMDGTLLAQKALSAAARTGERYGANHLIDVLLGRETEKVVETGHNVLRTFGVGTEISKDEWRSVFRQLTAQGLLSVDFARNGALVTTAIGRDVLHARRNVRLVLDVGNRTKFSSRSGRAMAPGLSDDLPREMRALWEDLRKKRMEIARREGVPPYIVFSDKTLVAILMSKPLNRPSLMKVPGVGESKVRRYGDEIIALIQESVVANAPSPPPDRVEIAFL